MWLVDMAEQPAVEPRSVEFALHHRGIIAAVLIEIAMQQTQGQIRASLQGSACQRTVAYPPPGKGPAPDRDLLAGGLNTVRMPLATFPKQGECGLVRKRPGQPREDFHIVIAGNGDDFHPRLRKPVHSLLEGAIALEKILLAFNHVTGKQYGGDLFLNGEIDSAPPSRLGRKVLRLAGKIFRNPRWQPPEMNIPHRQNFHDTPGVLRLHKFLPCSSAAWVSLTTLQRPGPMSSTGKPYSKVASLARAAFI